MGILRKLAGILATIAGKLAVIVAVLLLISLLQLAWAELPLFRVAVLGAVITFLLFILRAVALDEGMGTDQKTASVLLVSTFAVLCGFGICYVLFPLAGALWARVAGLYFLGAVVVSAVLFFIKRVLLNEMETGQKILCACAFWMVAAPSGLGICHIFFPLPQTFSVTMTGVYSLGAVMLFLVAQFIKNAPLEDTILGVSGIVIAVSIPLGLVTQQELIGFGMFFSSFCVMLLCAYYKRRSGPGRIPQEKVALQVLRRRARKKKRKESWELEDRLKELKEKRGRGIVTQEEYELRKKELLEEYRSRGIRAGMEEEVIRELRRMKAEGWKITMNNKSKVLSHLADIFPDSQPNKLYTIFRSEVEEK